MSSALNFADGGIKLQTDTKVEMKNLIFTLHVLNDNLHKLANVFK